MIPFTNSSRNTVLSDLSLHDHLEPILASAPPEPTIPSFNIFSPLQSLLSILNFTYFFQSSPFLDVYPTTVPTPSSTGFNETYETSMIIPHQNIFDLSPSQNIFNSTTPYPNHFSNWTPQEDLSENISGNSQSFEKLWKTNAFENRSINLNQNLNSAKDYYYPENFHEFPKEFDDYGMITEHFGQNKNINDLSDDDGIGKLNISLLEPIFNFTLSINESTSPTDSYNASSDEVSKYDETIFTILTAVILAFLILVTVVGNVFVIAAILLERNLQSVANYLILSLAVADLLVAALVMPLGAVYEVSKEWTLGPELCDMWTVSDVLCCTASILHLVAIALDRYWAVTNLDYIQQRSPKRVGTMIAIIWCVSTLISAAPLMGWKDNDWHGRIHNNKICLVSQDLYYQVFATMTSFYLPLGVILILYWRIYQAARKRIRRKVGARAQNALCRGAVAISETTTFTRVSSANESPEKSSNGAISEVPSDQRNDDVLRFKMAALPLNPLALLGARAPRKREMDARRERKAAKTLAVITGVFVICWLPFFVTALLMPLCTRCYFSPYLVATLLWLGYFNSTLNPIIYTIFSPDFRHAFRRILCGKRKLRKRQYDARVSSIKASKS